MARNIWGPIESHIESIRATTWYKRDYEIRPAVIVYAELIVTRIYYGVEIAARNESCLGCSRPLLWLSVSCIV